MAHWVAIIHSGKLVLCDKLDHLKRRKGYLTYVDLPPATEIETLRRLPNVVNLAQEGRRVRLLHPWKRRSVGTILEGQDLCYSRD